MKKSYKDISLTYKNVYYLQAGVSSGKSSVINSINGLSTRYDGATLSGEIKIEDKNTKELELL